MKKIFGFLAGMIGLYASAQNYQWAKGVGGSVGANAPNQATSVTTDVLGNVYITGCFVGTNVDFNPGATPLLLNSGSGVSTDIYFAKYNSAGVCIWAKALTGSGGIGASIALDPSGNVYLTGSFFNTNVDFDPGTGTATLGAVGNNDIFIAKYDIAGNYIWAKSIGGASPEIAMGISVDAAGNSYITGRYLSAVVDFDPGAGVANLVSAGGSDIYFAKYDSSGNYLWAKSVGSAGNDNGQAISTDASGNVYLSGSFQGGADFDPGPSTATLGSSNTDVFFAKYDTNGNYLWAHSLFGSSPGNGFAISAEANGNFYITGSFFGASVDFDPGPAVLALSAGTSQAMYFAKYDAAGNYLWAKSVPGAQGRSITKNAFGHVYIAGGFIPNTDFDPGPGTVTLNVLPNSPGNTTSNLYFAKYSATGEYIWAKYIGAPINASGNVYSIALDASSNVFLTGRFGGTTDFDPGPGTATLTAPGIGHFFLAKYTYCSTQAVNQQTICPGGGYSINGHFYTTSGLYKDTLFTSLGCDSIINTQLNASGQPPIVSVSSYSALCAGGSNTITANGALTYTWSTGFQTPAIIVNPNNVSQYVVTGTGSNSCTASATIMVNTNPTVGISGKQTVCKGDAIFLVASGADSYTWTGGTQTQTFLPTVITNTIYTVSGSYTNTNCRSEQNFSVYVAICLANMATPASNLQLKIFPNPVTTELVYTLNSSGSHRYAIMDFKGALITEGTQTGNKVSLNMSAYEPGIYYLKITVGSSSKSLKFIKE